jgi:hypothetical protein
VQTETEISETYSKMSDDELLRLANQNDSLLPVGQKVLAAEMQKREMDNAAVVSFRLREEELARQESHRATFEKQARAKKRRENFKRLGIFLTAAIVTAVLASELFRLPSAASASLTHISLSLFLGLFFITKAFGGAWLTIRKSIALAAGLSVCIFGWVIYMTVTAAK